MNRKTTGENIRNTIQKLRKRNSRSSNKNNCNNIRKGLNPLEVGFAYKGITDDKDVVSLLVCWQIKVI